MSKVITVSDVRPGDVLLCRNIKPNLVSGKISASTNSDYTHAAICVDSTTVAESRPPKGVSITTLNTLTSRYDFLAAFGQPDAWNPDRVKALKLFSDTASKALLNYNLVGVAYFAKNLKEHDQKVFEKLKAFFDDPQSHEHAVKRSYFCSEFVAQAFVVSGFLEPSAAIAYASKTVSPGALGRDPTFGTFVGYLPGRLSTIPVEDEFYNETPYDQIWGPR